MRDRASGKLAVVAVVARARQDVSPAEPRAVLDRPEAGAVWRHAEHAGAGHAGRLPRVRRPPDPGPPQGRARGAEPEILRHGRVLLSSRLSDHRGQAGRGHRQTVTCARRGAQEEGQGYPHVDAALRPHPRDRVPAQARLRRLRDDHRVSRPALHPSNALQRRYALSFLLSFF